MWSKEPINTMLLWLCSCPYSEPWAFPFKWCQRWNPRPHARQTVYCFRASCSHYGPEWFGPQPYPWPGNTAHGSKCKAIYISYYQQGVSLQSNPMISLFWSMSRSNIFQTPSFGNMHGTCGFYVSTRAKTQMTNGQCLWGGVQGSERCQTITGHSKMCSAVWENRTQRQRGPALEALEECGVFEKPHFSKGICF